MIKVVGVCFEKSNKIYYFLPNDNICNLNDFVIVETERGLQYGKVSTKLIEVDETKILIPVKNILRIATLEDAKINEKTVKDNERAIKSANKFIKELGIDMKILNASFTFDRNQLLFNFLADDRVDFRELAKKLASVYKTRIELRQIGVRDKAKKVCGIGVCGQKLCCSRFLNELIKSGYITIEDNDIKNYYELFNNIMQEYSSEDIYTSIHYITSKIKLNKFRDEDGNEISNKFGYFNNALKSNLNKLEYMKSETDLYGDDLFDDILNVKSDNER